MDLCIITEDDAYVKRLASVLQSFHEITIFHASNPKKFKEALNSQFDAAIIDYSISWANGIQVLKEIRKSKPFAAIIMVIDAAMQEVAAEAMKRGLDDYIIKGMEEGLPAAIRMAIERQKRRQREAMLSAIVENAKEAVISVDANGRIIYVNKATEEIFGWKAEELIGKSIEIMAIDKEEQRRQWREAIEKGGARFETVRKSKDGSIIPVLMTVIPFKDEYGNLLFSSGIMVDVREIKEYQNRIEHLNELLKAIRGINQIITMEKNEESLLEKACELLYDVKGYKMICISYGKDYWKGDESFYERVKEIKAGVKKLDGEHVFIKNFRKNGIKGKLCVVHSKNFDNEEIELLKEVSNDISFALHSIKVGREKEEAERKYRTIVEKANEGICIDDADEKIIFTNKTFANSLGYKEEELVGKNFLSLVYEDDKEKIEREIKRRKKGKASRYEIRLIAKDGSIKTFLVSALPLYENGEFVGSLSLNLDITEQIEMEKKFEAVFEGALDAIFIEDLDGNILDVNNAACKLLGYSKEELTRMNVADIVPEEIGKRFPELIEEHLKKGGIRMETINIHKNGKAIPVEVSTNLVDIADKKRVVAVVRDITQRKEMEERLKESEARFRSLVENARDGIYIITPEGFEYVNPAFEKITGYKREELYAPDFSFWKLIHEDDIPFIMKREKAREAGKELPPTYAFRIVRKDGSIRWVEVTTVSIGKKGEVRVIGILRDVTERKEMEKALKESEEKFRVLAENSPSAIFIIQDDVYKYVNSAMANMIGYTKEELLKMKFWDIVHPEDKNMVKERGKRRQRGEKFEPSRYELRVTTKDGKIRWVELAASPIIYDGKPAALGNAYDITERKKAEEEINKLSRLHYIIGKSINESHGIKQLSKKLLREIKKIIGIDFISLFIYNKKDGLLQPIIFYGYPKDFKDATMHAYIVDESQPWEAVKATLERKTRHIKDVRKYKPLSFNWKLYEKYDVKEIYTVPLVTKNELYGVIQILNTSRNPLKEEDRELLKSIAEEIAAGIAKIKAEEEMRRALEEERKFKADTAHYFFNPIAIAKGYLEIAKEDGGDKETIEKALKAIERVEKVVKNIVMKGEIHE